MRAYKPGERWLPTYDAQVVRDEPLLGLIANVRAKEVPQLSVARLIAESPIRDELLREIEAVLADTADMSGLWLDFLARIRDTLGRTE